MGKSYAELKLLFGEDRIHLAKALSKPEVDDLARGVARQMRASMEKRSPDTVEAYVHAARVLGATIHKMQGDDKHKGQDHGYYCWRTKRIIYDPDWDEWTVIHTLCHELAHHVLCHHRAGAIRGGVERYDDDRETLQHRIARRVEEILLG